MYLSKLQKFMLVTVYENKAKNVGRRHFALFYDTIESKPKPQFVEKTITRSLEHLIDRGFLIGLGERTRKKWYIRQVRLTPHGRRVSKHLRGEQLHLSF